jgi:hypothetical protein
MLIEELAMMEKELDIMEQKLGEMDEEGSRIRR